MCSNMSKLFISFWISIHTPYAVLHVQQGSIRLDVCRSLELKIERTSRMDSLSSKFELVWSDWRALGMNVCIVFKALLTTISSILTCTALKCFGYKYLKAIVTYATCILIIYNHSKWLVFMNACILSNPLIRYSGFYSDIVTDGLEGENACCFLVQLIGWKRWNVRLSIHWACMVVARYWHFHYLMTPPRATHYTRALELIVTLPCNALINCILCWITSTKSSW